MKIIKSVIRLCVPVFFLSPVLQVHAQTAHILDSFRVGDIKVTIDRPATIYPARQTAITFFALPNGNSTEQTMGKKMQAGDDWHFDIQHIAAQTAFIRSEWTNRNFVVIYLENDYRSWPKWKQLHPAFRVEIPSLVDSLISLVKVKDPLVFLNGHSGGGSFIFGYIAGVESIPATIRRISFLDSDYGYDSSYYPKIRNWLAQVKGASLNVFAYNDSIALYNGKPLVSAMGGTWYRSHLLLRHLQADYRFKKEETDSLIIYKNKNKRIQFFFKPNLNRGIYHTQQVELNGFIHSILCGTDDDSKRYKYYDKRAYQEFIQ